VAQRLGTLDAWRRRAETTIELLDIPWIPARVMSRQGVVMEFRRGVTSIYRGCLTGFFRQSEHLSRSYHAIFTHWTSRSRGVREV